MENTESSPQETKESLLKILRAHPAGKRVPDNKLGNNITQLQGVITKTCTPYTLRLHERYWDTAIYMDILRVPSGWIYSNWDQVTDNISFGYFVPLITQDAAIKALNY